MTIAEVAQAPGAVDLERAYDALYHCEWDALAKHATAAGVAGKEASDAPIEANRLVAASQFGTLDFAAAITEIEACVLLESLFGRPGPPSRPARFPLDVSPLGRALY